MRFIGQIRPQAPQKVCQLKCHNQRRLGFWSLGLCVALTAGVQPATGQEAAATLESGARLVNSPLIQSPDYSKKSDYELTELGARWDNLSKPQRSALLAEVKLRMAQRKDADGVLMIRTQRRYGRIYRSEGRYLKIETKVVRVRPANPEEAARSRSFGTGFEQRTATVSRPIDGESVDPETLDGQLPETPRTPPVVRVNDPSE